MLKYFKKLIYKNRNMEKYDVSMEELQLKQLSGAIIVDVRSSQEFAEGHIEGAINIPEYEIKNNVEIILNDKDKEIIVYCSSGVRSLKARKKLAKLGYNNVYNLYQGLENWQ